MTSPIHHLWHDLAPLDAAQIAQLERYLDLLEAGNAKMNLTRIVDRDHARLHHVADALTLVRHLPTELRTLADVGSGGGVPGLVLAIARPGVKVTLIESIGKKADFLRETARELGLGNAEVLRDRAEAVAKRGRRFDGVTCRAVAPVDKLLRWCRPLVKRGGVMLAMKGPKLREELAETSEAARQKVAMVVHEVAIEGLQGHVIAEFRWREKSS